MYANILKSSEAAKKAWLTRGKSVTAPTHVTFNGKKFTSTGKVGTSLNTEEPTHEYESVDAAGKRTGSKVWRTVSGVITPD